MKVVVRSFCGLLAGSVKRFMPSSLRGFRGVAFAGLLGAPIFHILQTPERYVSGWLAYWLGKRTGLNPSPNGRRINLDMIGSYLKKPYEGIVIRRMPFLSGFGVCPWTDFV